MYVRLGLLPRHVGLAKLKMKWPTAGFVGLAAVGSYLYSNELISKDYYNFGNAVLRALDPAESETDGNSKDKSSWWRGLFWRNRILEEEPSLPLDVMHRMIRKYEFGREIHRGIVSKFETNKYAANDPIEDRHTECYMNRANAQLYGIFDGHSGYHCSETVKERLPIYMNLAFGLLINNTLTDKISSLQDIELFGKVYDDLPHINMPQNFIEKRKMLGSDEDAFIKCISRHIADKIETTDLIKLVFRRLDQDISNEAVPNGVADESLLVGVSGSCAVAATINGNDLFVANTGDCRAVLGKYNTDGTWTAIQLTQDQTVKNRNELQRIYNAHPNERSTVITHERLLGQLQPLRAFGDVQYKWDKSLHDSVLDVVYGRPVVPQQSYLTPPYLTAEPVVTHKKISTEDRFLILASDGLWDRLGSEKAVKIVGEHIEQINKGELSEENASTKLIRFALGKGSNAALANIMRLPQHFKRHFHDDITVTVVYFESDKTSSKL